VGGFAFARETPYGAAQTSSYCRVEHGLRERRSDKIQIKSVFGVGSSGERFRLLSKVGKLA